MTEFGRDDFGSRLEQELRAAAPQARALFVDEEARRLHTQRLRMRPNRLRTTLALAFSALMVAALGVLGAPGYVAHAATAVVQTATTALTGGGSSSTGAGSGTSGATSGSDQYAVNHGICHRTGDAKIPWVLIVVSADALDAHAAHGDIIPAPPFGCPPAHSKGRAPTETGTNVGGSSNARMLQPAQFLVTVKASGGATPHGTVSCFDNLTRFADSIPLDSHGAAACTTIFMSLGTHQITAVFKTGDVNKWASSASADFTMRISPGSTPPPPPPPVQEQPAPSQEVAAPGPPAVSQVPAAPQSSATTTPEPATSAAPQVPSAPRSSATTTADPATPGGVTISSAPGSSGSGGSGRNGGGQAPTTVDWAPGTFGSALATVKANLQPPPAQQQSSGVAFAAGSAVVQIEAWTAAGQAIVQLDKVLDIAIPEVPAAITPMYQRGTDPWVVIPRLNGGSLPAGQPDGWYMDGSTLHILTRHLTRFGLAKTLDVRWGTRRRVQLHWAKRVIVYAAPSVDSTATYTLRRGKKVYGTWTRTLPAGKGAPANLWLAGKNVVPGRYKLTIVIEAGPQRWTQVVAIRYLG